MTNFLMILAITSCLAFNSVNQKITVAENTADTSKASVTQQQATLIRELKELRHTLARIKSEVRGLLSEYDRNESQILEFDQFMNEYIDDRHPQYNEQLYPYGFQNIGNTSIRKGPPLPPRKDWVAHYRENIHRLVTLAKSEFSDVSKMLSSEAATKDSSADALNGIDTAEQQLQKANPDEKAEIQHHAAEILDAIALLDQSSKKLVRRHLTTRN